MNKICGFILYIYYAYIGSLAKMFFLYTHKICLSLLMWNSFFFVLFVKPKSFNFAFKPYVSFNFVLKPYVSFNLLYGFFYFFYFWFVLCFGLQFYQVFLGLMP